MSNNSYYLSREGDNVEIKKITFEVCEDFLLSKIEKSKEENNDIELEKDTYRLANFYERCDKLDQAINVYENLITITNDNKRLAYYLFSQGQLHERVNNFSTAINYYQKSFDILSESNQKIRYYIFNNCGYCYNVLKDFSRGEEYCRQAIDINPEKSNAYKNLGISFEGQNRFCEAVETYLEATRKNSSDRRALDLLMNLIFEHPEIKGEIQDLDQKIEICLKTSPPPTSFSDALAYPLEW